MKVRQQIKSTSELKKMTYRILRKTHDLEKRRSKSYVIGRKLSKDDTLLVNLLITELYDLLDDTIGSVGLPYYKATIENYLRKLRRFNHLVEQNCQSENVLKRGYVAKLLQSHTRLFNLLLRDNIDIDLDLKTGRKWADTARLAVMIWDNNL